MSRISTAKEDTFEGSYFIDAKEGSVEALVLEQNTDDLTFRDELKNVLALPNRVHFGSINEMKHFVEYRCLVSIQKKKIK